jgi:hypothetical protein
MDEFLGFIVVAIISFGLGMLVGDTICGVLDSNKELTPSLRIVIENGVADTTFIYKKK